MSFSCLSLIKADNGKNAFDLKCGTYFFKPFCPLNRWNNVERRYIEYINNINDPILRHIFLYFVQYYIDGYDYFRDSPPVHRHGACSYLKEWLQEKKDLFTYGENCDKNLNSWNHNIEKLWDMLMNDYTISENKNPWCGKSALYQKTTYPDGLTSIKCEESISQESRSTDIPPLPEKTDCDCSQCVYPVNLEQLDHPQEKDRTKNLAVTSGFTAAGTLGTLFFLYRFTPMMSWFRRPDMNNVGTDLYMNSGGADTFLRMQNDDGGNNLFYHPSV